MLIWVDDVRQPPTDQWIWLKSVNSVINFIQCAGDPVNGFPRIEVISLDHDAGDFSENGGDYIKILDWLEETGIGCHYTYHIHSANVVGRQNMMRIIQRNGWNYILDIIK